MTTPAIEAPPSDGSRFVPLSPMRPPTAQEPGSSGDSAELTNLVTLFDEVEQKKIVQSVCDDFDRDVTDRTPRMKRAAEYQRLYASVMKAKTFPFQNAANVNLPILTYPLLQVQARLFDMVWPANGKILTAAPTN